MVQFNLLPDVKLDFIRAKYKRRIVTFICLVLVGIFVTIFVLLFLFVRVNQTNHLSNLDADIDNRVAQLKEENPELDRILTIQSQLDSLPQLHDDKVMSSRIFDYLTQITPNDAAVTNVEVDFEDNVISIKGVARSIPVINQFVDTIKFTEFTVKGEEGEPQKAFNSVVLDSFRLDENRAADDESSNDVTFEIKFMYEPVIFESSAVDGNPVHNKIELTVPNIITTRSETQKPANLFEQSDESLLEQQQEVQQ